MPFCAVCSSEASKTFSGDPKRSINRRHMRGPTARTRSEPSQWASGVGAIEAIFRYLTARAISSPHSENQQRRWRQGVFLQ
jgi:hypothetical protein